MTDMPPPAPPNRPAPGQEPWDYARFVETYNGLARRRGFWNFEPDGRTEESLRHKYQRFPADFPTLERFAATILTGDEWALA